MVVFHENGSNTLKDIKYLAIDILIPGNLKWEDF